jgi:hypothetical protein
MYTADWMSAELLLSIEESSYASSSSSSFIPLSSSSSSSPFSYEINCNC